MSISNKTQVRKIEAMSHEEKVAYFSTAKRVTVGTVSQVVKNSEGRNVFRTWYVAKIRGVVVGNKGEWKHESPEAALNYGREVLAQWHKDFTTSNKACSGRS